MAWRMAIVAAALLIPSVAACSGAGTGAHCQSGERGTRCYDHEQERAFGPAQTEEEVPRNERPGYVPPNPR